MKRKTLLLSAIMTLIAFSASASTVKWLIKSNYDTISYFGENVFKCVKSNRIQLFDLEGRTLLPFEADSVTDYSEGYALVLEKKANSFIIRGFLKEKGLEFIGIQGDYHAMLYSHFSENLLSVADEHNLFGYIDTSGNTVINCQYNMARPFIKGYASVETDDDLYYINPENKRMKIRGFHRGKLDVASSFNENGEALVGHYNPKTKQLDLAVISPDGTVIREYHRKSTEDKPFRVYDFAFDENYKSFESKHNGSPSFDSTIIPFYDKDYWGYKAEGDVIIPAQFDKTNPFSENCAIIVHNGKYGVITLTEGDFSSSLEGSDIFSNKRLPLYKLNLSVPDSFNIDSIQVYLDEGDEQLKLITLQDASYSFTPFLKKNTRKWTMNVEVHFDGLVLWQESITKPIGKARVSDIEISEPVKLTRTADSHDHLVVKTEVTNNTNKSMTVKITFECKLSVENNSLTSPTEYTEQISPNSKKEFLLDFIVVKSEDIKITVNAQSNRLSTSNASTLSLIPYD